jgi:hypothetical protein
VKSSVTQTEGSPNTIDMHDPIRWEMNGGG